MLCLLSHTRLSPVVESAKEGKKKKRVEREREKKREIPGPDLSSLGEAEVAASAISYRLVEAQEKKIRRKRKEGGRRKEVRTIGVSHVISRPLRRWGKNGEKGKEGKKRIFH